jgi:hypothetical protein
MLEGYERLAGAAVDYARRICLCFGVPVGALDGCAFADAHEYSGLRINSPDSKHCFEQELAPVFPEIVECETRHLESLRDCAAKSSCQRSLATCESQSSCGAMPDYAAYRDRRERCREVLYCDDGREAAGWRCNGTLDCLDESDEAGC